MSTTFDHIKGDIVVNVQLDAKPGKGDEVATFLKKLKQHADSEAEPGTLLYVVARDGDKFVAFERYEGVDAIKAHSATELFQSFKASGLIAEPPTALFYSAKL